MSEHEITVEGGTSVRLPTAGKYCDRDIIVTSTGGSDEEDVARSIVERTITSYSNKELKTVGYRGFSHCASLESVDLPELTSIDTQGFNSCGKLKRVVFPKLTTITQGDNFTYCYALEYADLGIVTNIPSWCLANCTALETVILRKSDGICTLKTTNALNSNKFTNGTAFVYVPAELVDTYKSATNWSTYAEQIRAIEDYPEITGGATP